jgi:hypothetical protein
MSEDQCLEIAEGYLSSHAIEHVRPTQIGSKEEGRWELSSSFRPHLTRQ